MIKICCYYYVMQWINYPLAIDISFCLIWHLNHCRKSNIMSQVKMQKTTLHFSIHIKMDWIEIRKKGYKIRMYQIYTMKIDKTKMYGKKNFDSKMLYSCISIYAYKNNVTQQTCREKCLLCFGRGSKSINAAFMVNILMSSKCIQKKRALYREHINFEHLALSRSRNRSFFFNEWESSYIHIVILYAQNRITLIHLKRVFMQNICMENEHNNKFLFLKKLIGIVRMHLVKIEFQCKQICQINVANNFWNNQNAKYQMQKIDVSYTTSIYFKTVAHC